RARGSCPRAARRCRRRSGSTSRPEVRDASGQEDDLPLRDEGRVRGERARQALHPARGAAQEVALSERQRDALREVPLAWGDPEQGEHVPREFWLENAGIVAALERVAVGDWVWIQVGGGTSE